MAEVIGKLITLIWDISGHRTRIVDDIIAGEDVFTQRGDMMKKLEQAIASGAVVTFDDCILVNGANVTAAKILIDLNDDESRDNEENQQ